MLAGETVVGVLGIRDGSTLTHDERKGLAAATGLIAIAVRNVHLLLAAKEHGLRDGLTRCQLPAEVHSIEHPQARREPLQGDPLGPIADDAVTQRWVARAQHGEGAQHISVALAGDEMGDGHDRRRSAPPGGRAREVALPLRQLSWNGQSS